MLRFFLLITGYCLLVTGTAVAGYDDGKFRQEVLDGLDIIVAKSTANDPGEDAVGALGTEIYDKKIDLKSQELAMYIPTDMYIRGGGGINLGFASDSANVYGHRDDMSGGWNVQMGLGFNMSSYVRTELDFQVHEFGFSDYDDAVANSRQFGGTLYFDFARRYVRTGDITRRRTFVPFMGLGAGVGMYEFAGADGADGFFVAPRAILGFNVMFSDLIGMDISYQYQMFIGDGFGWGAKKDSVHNLSDLMISFRYNF